MIIKLQAGTENSYWWCIQGQSEISELDIVPVCLCLLFICFSLAGSWNWVVGFGAPWPSVPSHCNLFLQLIFLSKSVNFRVQMATFSIQEATKFRFLFLILSPLTSLFIFVHCRQCGKWIHRTSLRQCWIFSVIFSMWWSNSTVWENCPKHTLLCSYFSNYRSSIDSTGNVRYVLILQSKMQQAFSVHLKVQLWWVKDLGEDVWWW